jgi:hypothetical protein
VGVDTEGKAGVVDACLTPALIRSKSHCSVVKVPSRKGSVRSADRHRPSWLEFASRGSARAAAPSEPDDPCCDTLASKTHLSMHLSAAISCGVRIPPNALGIERKTSS